MVSSPPNTTENKWQCLHCGNRFLYEQPTAPITNISTRVSLDASALYDIDTGGGANNKPIIQALPQPFAKDELYAFLKKKKEAKERGMIIGILVGFIGGISLINTDITLINTDIIGTLFGVALVTVSVISFFYFLRSSRRILKELNGRERYLQTTPVVVGTVVLCPYCHADYKSFLQGKESPRELTHCMKCGKQFLIDGLYSFRIKIK